MKFTSEIQISCEYEVEEFDKAVLVTSKLSGEKAPCLPRNVTIPQSAHTIDIFTISFYHKMCKAYGKQWITKRRTLPRTEVFTVVTKNYLEWYKNNCHVQYDGDDYYAKDPKRILRKGLWDRVVTDWTWFNGVMYGLDGKPVCRRISFDEIDGPNSREYRLEECQKLLESNEKVHNLKRAPIPPYNGGGHALTFTYEPTPREFQNLVKNTFKDLHRAEDEPTGGIGWETKYKIKERLKIEKCRRKEPLPECEYYEY